MLPLVVFGRCMAPGIADTLASGSLSQSPSQFTHFNEASRATERARSDGRFDVTSVTITTDRCKSG